jgi:beta-mannanase
MGGYRTFKQIFQAPYNRLRALGDQPIWFAEVGSAPEGGSKAKWVRDMFATARQWKQLQAIVWFDQNKEQDWRAAPDDAVAAAFSA